VFVQRAEEPELRAVGPNLDSFMNLNAPDDYARALMMDEGSTT
jgi:hypothetical protein